MIALSRATLTLTALAGFVTLLSTSTLAQTQPQAPTQAPRAQAQAPATQQAQGIIMPRSTSRSRTQQQRLQWYGQDLINAEAAVGTARGECRSFSRQPKQDGTQRTREETSLTYQECMRAKESGEAQAAQYLSAPTIR